MSQRKTSASRRDFLKSTGTAAAAAASVPYFLSSQPVFANQAKNDRPRIGCIGVGSMGTGDARGHASFGDILAVCDVDSRHAERFALPVVFTGEARGRRLVPSARDIPGR